MTLNSLIISVSAGGKKGTGIGVMLSAEHNGVQVTIARERERETEREGERESERERESVRQEERERESHRERERERNLPERMRESHTFRV